MNWGYKIVFGFSAFVILIITMVTISLRTDFFLVEENYYEEELAFQDKIDSRKNAGSWKTVIDVKNNAETIEIFFEEAAKVKTGKVSFFRPSDATLDFSFPIVEHLQLPKSEIQSGKWIVNIVWEFDGKHFTKETIIFI